MAREIRAVADSGSSPKARIMNPLGLWWNGSAFEAYSSVHYANYLVTLTEQGVSGVFVADFPSISVAGSYEYFVHTGSAEGDLVVNTGKIDWTGTDQVTITAATDAMSGSDWRDYVLRRGFKRTDKDAELYEATTDAIQEMRRRFEFDEAKVDQETSTTIAVLGNFKLDVEADMGMLLGLILQDGRIATPLIKKSKREFDMIYPDIANTTDKGYPKHYTVFAGKIYIGPVPDRTTFIFRESYSRRAGTITSSTAGVPFTNLYRDVLLDLTLSLLYDGLEEYDKAGYYRNAFETGFLQAVRRERVNGSLSTFNMAPTDF